MSLLDLGDGVLWFILSITLPPNMVGWVDTKDLELRFIWPHHFLPNLLRIIQIFPVKLKTGVYMWHLEDLGGWEVLFLVTVLGDFPTAFLGWATTFLISHSSILLNNYSSSRHLLTKLLAGLVARSSFVQVCGLVPDVLWQFFGFAHIGWNGKWFCGQVWCICITSCPHGNSWSVWLYGTQIKYLINAMQINF